MPPLGVSLAPPARSDVCHSTQAGEDDDLNRVAQKHHTSGTTDVGPTLRRLIAFLASSTGTVVRAMPASELQDDLATTSIFNLPQIKIELRNG